MKIVFTSDRDFMTYQHYVEQRKSMLEWILMKKVYENPKVKVNYSWLPVCSANNVWDNEEKG